MSQLLGLMARRDEEADVISCHDLAYMKKPKKKVSIMMKQKSEP